MDNPGFGLAEMVKELGMSRTVVHTKFRELINSSTGEFIKITRLKKACQLIKERKYRISEICYMVGFSDPHYFSKAFKSFYGIPPSQFIDDVENNKS